MSQTCNTCVTDKEYCSRCIHNPDYKPYFNYYSAYKPTCKFARTDCVHDPAYIKYIDPEWYQLLYGTQTPEEAAANREGCLSCKSGEQYDDEDK